MTEMCPSSLFMLRFYSEYSAHRPEPNASNQTKPLSHSGLPAWSGLLPTVNYIGGRQVKRQGAGRFEIFRVHLL